MNLAEIRNAGGFIRDEATKVSINWAGHSFDVFVKKLSFGDVERLHAGNDDSRSRLASMVSTAVLLGENREAISYEDAYRLDIALAAELIGAINSVNSLDSKKKS